MAVSGASNSQHRTLDTITTHCLAKSHRQSVTPPKHRVVSFYTAPHKQPVETGGNMTEQTVISAVSVTGPASNDAGRWVQSRPHRIETGVQLASEYSRAASLPTCEHTSVPFETAPCPADKPAPCQKLKGVSRSTTMRLRGPLGRIAVDCGRIHEGFSWNFGPVVCQSLFRGVIAAH